VKLAGAAAKRFLSKPAKEARAVLLFGPNRSAIEEAVEALTDFALGPSPDAMAITRLGEDELRRDKALLSDQLAAQSLLGGPRLLRVRADGDSAADSIVHAVAALDDDAPVAAFLIVESSELAARSKIRVAFENAARSFAMAFYEDDDEALTEYAQGVLKERGVKLEPDAWALFESSLPGDRGLIRAEAEKLALFAYGRSAPITAPEAAALLAIESEAALDDATLAVAGGVAAAAVDNLHKSDAGGITAIKALERRLLRLQEARAAVDRGSSPTEAAAQLRPPVFWKERDAFAGHLRIWSQAKLLAGLDILWRAQVRAMTAGAPQELIAAEAYRAVANLANRR
jgi:DNA polymerase-3 subunit delta